MQKLSKVLGRVSLFFLLVCSLDASSLIEHYPFSPPGYQAAPEALKKTIPKPDPEVARFTLRGVSKFGANYYFSIYDRQTKKSKWIEAGTPCNGFTILKYEPLESRIHFNWKGSSHTIRMANADETPINLVNLKPNKKTDSIGAKMNNAVTPSDEIQNGEKHTGTKHNINSEAADQSDDPANGQAIFFTPQTDNAGNPASVLWGRDSNLFAATDIPASSMPVEAEPVVLPQRFKVKRKNTVHNPSGKKPQHLSFAQWQTLKAQ